MNNDALSNIGHASGNINVAPTIGTQVQDAVSGTASKVASGVSSFFLDGCNFAFFILKGVALWIFSDHVIELIIEFRDYLYQKWLDFKNYILKPFITFFLLFFLQDANSWGVITVICGVILMCLYFFSFPLVLQTIFLGSFISLIVFKILCCYIKNSIQDNLIATHKKENEDLEQAIKIIKGIPDLENLFKDSKEVVRAVKEKKCNEEQRDAFLKYTVIPKHCTEEGYFKTHKSEPSGVPLYCPVLYDKQLKNANEAFYVFCKIHKDQDLTYEIAKLEIEWQPEQQHAIVEALKYIQKTNDERFTSKLTTLVETFIKNLFKED